jgi:hypothetical protein
MAHVREQKALIARSDKSGPEKREAIEKLTEQANAAAAAFTQRMRERATAP